jgi:hypothetical protein
MLLHASLYCSSVRKFQGVALTSVKLTQDKLNAQNHNLPPNWGTGIIAKQATLAQSEEQPLRKRPVIGSSPMGGSFPSPAGC